MATTDFAVHTRYPVCSKCVRNTGDGCLCITCKGEKELCGLYDKVPMRGSCKWNSILLCRNYKEK